VLLIPCEKLNRTAYYNPQDTPAPPADVTISAFDYTDFLWFQAAKQPTSPVTIVAQSGNPVAFVSQSFVLGTWLLDFGASDHMTSNQSLTQLSFPDSLPSITLADGSQIKVCGIGQTRPLPNLSLDSVLFVPGCPFNLISVSKPIHSLNFFVLFVNNAMAAATCEIIWLRQLLQQLQFEDTKDTKLIYNS